ncbi:MAG TPA: glycosyltransferase family 39 protein [Solirubrobacteraceae bacterium]|nr:glycosyltransferase family 39 protein [Solirubrobacteraceae bacterium]
MPRPAPRHLALLAILALSAVLNVVRLSQNAYGNIFYSAGVRSMLRSWHNFLFVSFDPAGLITIDKPPLALWVQAASAKLFGFAPLPLLLPEAIMGVLAVLVLYLALTRSFGALAGLSGALALAVFPSFVAVSRVNGVDPLLILLMTLAADAALRACASGRWRALLWCAVLVGLAFNAKTLAAYLVVPGIVVAYALCAPGAASRRLAQLAVAGVLMLVISFAWIAFVEATPASERPYVGGSTNNTELGLTFDYNGLGRVEGEVGGPGQIPVGSGAIVHTQPPAPRARRAPAPPSRAHPAPTRPATQAHTAPQPSRFLPDGRERDPIAFGGPVGPLRLFGTGLGDQGAWMLPFALLGLLATALVTLGAGRDRRDPRLAALLVLGGWFLVEAAVLSLSKGIVHPYYVAALGPGLAAMCGTGVVSFAKLARGPLRDWRRVLAPLAIAATVAAQAVLLRREQYLLWLVPVLIAGAAVAACALLSLRRVARGVLAAAFALVLVAPTAYATTTWLAPVEGTFPAAGPKAATGSGLLGIGPVDEARDRLLQRYIETHEPTQPYELLAVASNTASPFILMGHDAAALAGYSGTDPAVSARELARMVAERHARYVILGGEFATRGGNAATLAVLRGCRELPPTSWQGSPPMYLDGLTLFDCAGRARELAAS